MLNLSPAQSHDLLTADDTYPVCTGGLLEVEKVEKVEK
jgi:hypothetical protein